MFVLNGYGKKKKTVTGEIVMKYTIEVGGDSDEERIDSVLEMFRDHYDDVIGDFLGKMLYSVEFGDPRVLQPFMKRKKKGDGK